MAVRWTARAAEDRARSSRENRVLLPLPKQRIRHSSLLMQVIDRRLLLSRILFLLFKNFLIHFLDHLALHIVKTPNSHLSHFLLTFFLLLWYTVDEKFERRPLESNGNPGVTPKLLEFFIYFSR